ncbi:MAG: rod-binding protein [Desulfovibrionaceae bacterium]|nr:rod-binding protein [Desulfovibrionaceae bacterium]
MNDPLTLFTNQAGDDVRRKLEMERLRSNLKAPQDQKAKLREACEGFEAIFIQKIWEQMRKNVPQDGYLHSREEAMYQGMYDQEFARKMASSGGIGLADMLYDQLAQRMGDSVRTSSPGRSPASPVLPAGSFPSGSAALRPLRDPRAVPSPAESALNLQPEEQHRQIMPSGRSGF